MIKKLYKYTTLDTAIKIFKNRAFRFSSPIAFNDPFDMQNLSIYGYDKNIFAKDFVNVYSCEIERIEKEKQIPKDVYLLRILIEALGMCGAKEQFAKMLANEENFGFKQTENKYYEMIKPICNSYGIFCTSLTYDNILMWSHYAYCHQGVVLEISPSIEKKSIFLKSKKVTYSNNRPSLFKSPKIMIERLCMESAEYASELMEDLTYLKSDHWKYEKEYRLAIPNWIEKGKTFRDVSFAPEEISAVYLGCNMSLKNQDKVIMFANKLNPSIKIFLGRQHLHNFCLVFEEKI